MLLQSCRNVVVDEDLNADALKQRLSSNLSCIL